MTTATPAARRYRRKETRPTMQDDHPGSFGVPTRTLFYGLFPSPGELAELGARAERDDAPRADDEDGHEARE